jgi:hypothetical protein
MEDTSANRGSKKAIGLFIHIMAPMERLRDEVSIPVCFEVAMRMLILIFLAFGILWIAGVAAEEPPNLQAFVQDSRGMAKAFAGNLKSELQAAIKEGGPIHAIPVCNVRAPEIARDMSEPLEWTIGRTSYKVRNPSNAPDEWETTVLDEFLQRAAAGEDLSTMEKAELTQINGRPTYRYMKALPVGEVCLTCHGTSIDPELKAQIDSYYPEDQATGFALGGLRGAFTITKAAPN